MTQNQTLINQTWINWGCGVFTVLLVGGLITWLVFAVQEGREAALRMTCTPSQLALAFRNYHEVHGSYPPAYTVDENGKPLHSWRVLILPLVERQDLYEKIRLDEPWDSPHNSQFHKPGPMSNLYGHFPKPPSHKPGPVLILSCRSREKECVDGLAHYQMVIGPDTISSGPNSTKIEDITHHSETFLVVETSFGIPWMSPQDLPQSALANGIVSSRPQGGKPVVQGIGSPHRNGAFVITADFSRTFLDNDTPPEKLLEYSRVKPREKGKDEK
jgi:hypothetical protein